MDIELWHVYKLTTNAENDVWTKKELWSHHLSPDLKNDVKYRYSVPIEKVRNINGEDVYLIFQTNGTEPKYNNYFGVDGLIPLKNKSYVTGYIIPINVRLALAREWDDEFTKEKGDLGTVNPGATTPIYKACYILMNQSPRLQFIKDMKAGKYDKLNKADLAKLIKYDQFDKVELKDKGLKKEVKVELK